MSITHIQIGIDKASILLRLCRPYTEPSYYMQPSRRWWRNVVVGYFKLRVSSTLRQ